MGSGQVMKPRRPAQDFARDFGGLNVDARVFRNGDKATHSDRNVAESVMWHSDREVALEENQLLANAT